MDIVLEVFDYHVGDWLYAKAWPCASEAAVDLSAAIIPPLRLADYQEIFSKALLPGALYVLELFNGSVTQQLAQRSKDIYGVLAGFLPTSPLEHALALARTNIFRQVLLLFVIMTVFGWLLYLGVAAVSYVTVFDKLIFNHPRYLKNQVRLEVTQAMTLIPVMVLLTIPWFLLELRGYSKLYMNIDELTGGWRAVAWQVPTFIMFTDCGIYFIHRWLHWPLVYKHLHKPHHKWIVCTPFALHAFHPVDGYAQSLPYHWYPFLFPLHKVSYLLLFTFVNFWTVMIHDGAYFSNDPFVNGTACHTIHHLYFNYNYGQFTTLWDRLGKLYRRPDDNLFDRNKKDTAEVWLEQVRQMEEILDVVEGDENDRVYANEKSG